MALVGTIIVKLALSAVRAAKPGNPAGRAESASAQPERRCRLDQPGKHVPGLARAERPKSEDRASQQTKQEAQHQGSLTSKQHLDEAAHTDECHEAPQGEWRENLDRIHEDWPARCSGREKRRFQAVDRAENWNVLPA